MHERMTWIRGDWSGRAGVLPLVLVATMMMAGCVPQTAVQVPAGMTPSPTPTAACPVVEGVDLPPECAPYDPDQAMAQNERYRDRMDMSAESTAAARGPAEEIRTKLEGVRSSGSLSVDAVSEAITRAGLPYPEVQGDERAVEFGVSAPEGGCVFGAVTADLVTVEIGGYIMDGGCLPAVGH